MNSSLHPFNQPLRVGLDLRGLEPGFKAHFGRGTGRYIEELVTELQRQNHPEFEFILAGAKELGAGALAKIFRSVVPVGRTTIEQQLLLPRRIKRLGVDCFHFFAHGDAPIRCPVPYITTVLDLIPLKFPDLYKAQNANWRFRLARYLELQAIRNAHGIIAISECTKRDVVSMLGVDPNKIMVTPLGLSENFAERLPLTDTERQQLREQLGLPQAGAVCLYVGGIDPRKNVPFLFQALRELRDPNVTLLLVGKYDGDKHLPELRRNLVESGVEGQVRMVGYLPDDTLKDYYRAADVFLFPSLYEGFGFPVLEAFALGVPVICGDNSALGEVAGDSALLCEDNHLSSWVRAIREVLGSRELRAELIAKGRVQQAKFRWPNTVRATVDAYRYFFGLPAAFDKANEHPQSGYIGA